MPKHIDRCERCGKTHLGAWVWLELNTYTGRYHQPGEVRPDDSQGLFQFGPDCAQTVLKNGGHNQQIRRQRRA